MAERSTLREFLTHYSTQCKIDMIQETLRNVAAELDTLNATNPSDKLERLHQILYTTSGRIYMLKLNVDDPPTYYALGSTKSRKV